MSAATELDEAISTSTEGEAESQVENVNPEGDVAEGDTEGAGSTGQKQQRRYATLELVEGYANPEADIVYLSEAATAAGYTPPPFVELLKRHAAQWSQKNGSQIVVEISQTHQQVRDEAGKVVKGEDGKAVKGALLSTRVYIDTPESAAAAKRNGRKERTPKAPKKAEAKDLPKILRAMVAMTLDEEFLAEAKTLNRDADELARERACEKHNVSLEELTAYFAKITGAKIA